MCERREGGQKKDTSLGRRRGTGMRPVSLSSAHKGPPQPSSNTLPHTVALGLQQLLLGASLTLRTLVYMLWLEALSLSPFL